MASDDDRPPEAPEPQRDPHEAKASGEMSDMLVSVVENVREQRQVVNKEQDKPKKKGKAGRKPKKGADDAHIWAEWKRYILSVNKRKMRRFLGHLLEQFHNAHVTASFPPCLADWMTRCWADWVQTRRMLGGQKWYPKDADLTEDVLRQLRAAIIKSFFIIFIDSRPGTVTVSRLDIRKAIVARPNSWSVVCR